MTTRRVLFVCTGNIFRSLAAEYALRAALRVGSDVLVTSAGTDDLAHEVRPAVREYLLAKGLDVSGHRRRTVTAGMLEEADLVVAMSTEHRVFLRERFNLARVPLFTEACGLPEEPLPDVDEVIPDHATNPVAAVAHIRMTIDRIIALTPRLAERLAPRGK